MVRSVDEVARFCERRAMLRQGLDVYGRYPGWHVELRAPIQISCVMDAEVFEGSGGRSIFDGHPCAMGEDGWGRGGCLGAISRRGAAGEDGFDGVSVNVMEFEITGAAFEVRYEALEGACCAGPVIDEG